MISDHSEQVAKKVPRLGPREASYLLDHGLGEILDGLAAQVHEDDHELVDRRAQRDFEHDPGSLQEGIHLCRLVHNQHVRFRHQDLYLLGDVHHPVRGEALALRGAYACEVWYVYAGWPVGAHHRGPGAGLFEAASAPQLRLVPALLGRPD